jgi:hypothetical protein
MSLRGHIAISGLVRHKRFLNVVGTLRVPSLKLLQNRGLAPCG